MPFKDMGKKIIHHSTARDFLDWLNPANQEWKTCYFRGVACADKHLLIPSVWRETKNIQNLYENFLEKFEKNGIKHQILSLLQDWKKQYKLSDEECCKYHNSFYRHCSFWHFEQYLLSTFYTVSNKAGFSLAQPDLKLCFQKKPESFIHIGKDYYLEYLYFMESFFKYRKNNIYKYDVILVKEPPEKNSERKLLTVFKNQNNCWHWKISQSSVEGGLGFQNKELQQQLENCLAKGLELPAECKNMVLDTISINLERTGYSVMYPPSCMGGTSQSYSEVKRSLSINSKRHLWSLPGYFDLSLPQHYGLPTRALDWTHHPWKAAFFAAYNLCKDGFKTEENGELAVYAIKINDRSRPDSFIKILDEHNRYLNKYLHAQDG